MTPDRMVKSIFNRFDWDALDDDEKDVLKGGIEKHKSVLQTAWAFIPFQVGLTIVAPKIAMLVTVASFITLFLGSAWYNISFQNVSLAQLIAGVADYITKKMFRGFILSWSMLIIGAVVYIIKIMLPEIPFPSSASEVNLGIRIILTIANVLWLLIVWWDVYGASVAYDGSDSLLGDGFPTLMRGARATASNLPILKTLEELVDLMKKERGKPEDTEAENIPDPETPDGLDLPWRHANIPLSKGEKGEK